MLNQVVLVGRLTDDVEVVKTENGKSYSTITLAVQRSFKNSEGVYEADFIRGTRTITGVPVDFSAMICPRTVSKDI